MDSSLFVMREAILYAIRVIVRSRRGRGMTVTLRYEGSNPLTRRVSSLEIVSRRCRRARPSLAVVKRGFPYATRHHYIYASSRLSIGVSRELSCGRLAPTSRIPTAIPNAPPELPSPTPPATTPPRISTSSGGPLFITLHYITLH